MAEEVNRPPARMITGIALIAASALFSGCASPGSNTGPTSRDNWIPGFHRIESRVSDQEWENTFFRIARDVRLLSKLHPEIRSSKPELLAGRDGQELLFRAPIKLSGIDRPGRRALLQSTIRKLFGTNPTPDFQQTQGRLGLDEIHSEGVLNNSNPIAKVSIYGLNGDSETAYLIGGVRTLSGNAPFALEQHLQELLLPLLH